MSRLSLRIASIASIASIACFAAMSASAASAPDGDPLESPQCLRALEALKVQESAAASVPAGARAPEPYVRHAPMPALERSRREAARLCLGGNGDPERPPQHLAMPPISVAPVTGSPLPPPSALAQPSSSLAPSPLRPAPAVPLDLVPRPRPAPPIVTACDASGCWASDGSRLQRAGPGSNLLGPRGLCTTVGVMLQCP